MNDRKFDPAEVEDDEPTDDSGVDAPEDVAAVTGDDGRIREVGSANDREDGTVDRTGPDGDRSDDEPYRGGPIEAGDPDIENVAFVLLGALAMVLVFVRLWLLVG